MKFHKILCSFVLIFSNGIICFGMDERFGNIEFCNTTGQALNLKLISEVAGLEIMPLSPINNNSVIKGKIPQQYSLASSYILEVQDPRGKPLGTFYIRNITPTSNIFIDIYNLEGKIEIQPYKKKSKKNILGFKLSSKNNEPAGKSKNIVNNITQENISKPKF